MTEESFYVKIDNPMEFRKTLLLSVRDTLHSLQTFEKFKHLRVQRIEETIKLKKLTKEINSLLNRLKQDMPGIEMPKEKKVRAMPKKKPVKKKTIKQPSKKKVINSELDELEGQLKDIESKLKVLN